MQLRFFNFSGIRDLYAVPDFKAFVNNLHRADLLEDLEDYNILFTCFEFVREAVTRWKSIHEQEYLASQRRIRYLHSAKFVEQMKDFLSKTDENTKRFAYEWKPPQTNFLQSLPELSSDQ